MQNLEWRPLPGYEGRYEITIDGKVRSLWCRGRPRPQPKVLMKSPLRYKDVVQTLVDDTGKPKNVFLRPLIKQAFFGRCALPPAEKPRELKGNAKLTVAEVRQLRDRRRKGEQVKWLAVEYGISRAQVENIMNGRSWSNVA